MAKIGARLIRAAFVGNLIGLLLFLVFFLSGGVLSDLGYQGLKAIDWGIIGWLTGVSASIGIELSKDLEEQDNKGAGQS